MKTCLLSTALLLALLPLAATAAVPELTPSLRDEALKQYTRLENLRTGKLPMSRFATPDLVHQQASLITPADRDPADIVIRRTRALYNDLAKNPAAPAQLLALQTDLQALETDAKTIPVDYDTTDARTQLYLRACALRRQIAFANPLLDFDKIVFITHKKNPFEELYGDHMAGQYYGIHATKGEGLFILENAFSQKPAAKNIIQKNLPDGACLSPTLSYDGKKILFAHTEAAGYIPAKLADEDKNGMYDYSGLKCSFTDKNTWHIYSINTDGADLHQLTNGVYNDFDPCYLPDGKIAFISDRRGGFGRCHKTANGGAPWFTYTLHRMDADGTNMERLSHHETCEWQPSVLHDGNIVYTRWDYVDRGFYQAHHPWTTTPDGRNAIALHGNYPASWKDRPCMELEIRAIPGSQNLSALAAAHHGQTYGSIVIVNPMVDDDDAMSPVRLITPDERFPETEYGYFCREASYSTPWPLSENYYLCVFGYPEKGKKVPNKHDGDLSTENYGIYLLDAFGNIELLYRDPKISCLSPIPLKARPTPPIIPDMVQPLRIDPNERRLNTDHPGPLGLPAAPQTDNYAPAEVSIMNVYDSRLPLPEGVKITHLRVIQVLPKSNPGRNNPAIGYGTEKNARRVLGTVPVESDGSARFYLRPYIPVFFQLLDDQGRAVQSMRSDVYTAPKENLSCLGCHEPRPSAPPIQHYPAAMKRDPSRITPDLEGSNPFNYVKLVQPVLDRNCVTCHGDGADAKKPNLTGKIEDKKNWTLSYRNLKPYAFFYDGKGSFVESKTHPGKFGALASKLYQLLQKGHENLKLPPDDMRRLTLWLDCNSDFYGAYENIESQRHGHPSQPIME